MTIPVTIVFEDELSEYVLTRMLSFFGNKYSISQSYPANGFGYIKSNIKGFNNASKFSPFIILTDLDNIDCPIKLIEDWLPKKVHEQYLIFRIAVREVESWLLADIEGFSLFSGVSQANFPILPELENDPKSTLMGIIKKSKKRKIKEDILPTNDNAKVGPNYNTRLGDFVCYHWNINNAKNRSLSLKSAMDCLQRFEYNY
ncbi:DUF4276 family protein [Dyadobacter sp. CY345]|uniref:DUF4276 family protein n=1 Tax=Dyadobacter sp. CY345 TaxID=2909335 RepID=UPI001F314CE3|nr:DUF4276 family protein [Dyadobacter sp. CY345]